MSEPGSSRPGDPGDPDNPFGFLFGAGGPDLSAALHQFADLLSGSGGPVNWDLARRTAMGALPSADVAVHGNATGDAADALRLADLWLDPVTTLPAAIVTATAWSRREWLETTLPAWQQLVEPLAVHVVDAMGSALPAEAQAMAGPLSGMMRQIGGAMFGGQVGQALASLATEVLSATDVGIPLTPAGKAALLTANVVAFAEASGLPTEEVRLYLALREAAHQRLFAHAPWLRSHVVDLVTEYAAGITVDTSGIEEAMRELDPGNPEALQQALTGGLFEPQDTPAQQAALARLETALALIAGWVDDVVDAAASERLPSSGALRETLRRRRAEGGPAEQTLATLVGLELRPRRLRDAATLWGALRQRHGIEARDTLWAHPDLLPSSADLDDPLAFSERAPGADDWGAELPGWDSPPADEPPAPSA